MSSALSIGTTGLTASSKQMDVIGNNLANANTLGFKAGSTFFASLLNQSLSGGDSGLMQVGQGVSLEDVGTQFAAGSFESTSSATDLAIDGEGFFIVEDKDGAQYYTRAGAFHINEDGYLVDVNDYKVQGYNMFSTTMEDEQTDICLKNVQSAPLASTEISVGANLNDEAVPGEKFNVSQTVFDSKGQMHNLSITFMKTEGQGLWGFDIKLDENNISTDQVYSGVVFDKDGNLTQMYTADITVPALTQGSFAMGTPTVTNAGGGTASSTVNDPSQLTQATSSTIVLTRGADESTWTVTGNGGYTGMAVATANATTLALDMDGGGGADITFDLSGVWASGDTIAFDVNAVTGTVAATIDRIGQLYKDSTEITLTRGVNENIWIVSGNGGYENMAVQSANASEILLDLDGAGGTDITFDLTGSFAEGDTIKFTINNSLNDPGAITTPTDILMTFGDLPNGATIGDTSAGRNQMTWNIVGDDALKLTGYASTSVVKSLADNGYTSGVLKSLSIDSTGLINGFFTNGQSSKLGQIILASFPDPSGLKKVGNYFGETASSGQAIKNRPGSGGLGEVMSNTLESSNTDVAKEFINMIMAQRAYQASARVITTADEMQQELMNIKR